VDAAGDAHSGKQHGNENRQPEIAGKIFYGSRDGSVRRSSNGLQLQALQIGRDALHQLVDVRWIS
jgi:hypothetical protein